MAHIVSCDSAVRFSAALVTAVAPCSGSQRAVSFSNRILPGLRGAGGVVRGSRSAGFSQLRATRLKVDEEDEGLVVPVSDESEESEVEETAVKPVAPTSSASVTKAVTDFTKDVTETLNETGDLEEAFKAVKPVASASAASVSEAVTDFTMDVRETVTGTGDLKQALIDNFYGTERGLRASGETRGEIVEIISQLEALNPTPSPTEASALLDGKWILAYTSFSELFPFLAAGNLPLVKVGEISQTIDVASSTVENSVSFNTPLAKGTFGANASFSVRSPKRVQVKFLESVIGTPQITDSLELPSELTILGQTIDIRPLQALLQPVQSATSSLARTISEQPSLKIPFPSSMGAESWLLTTYLDEDIRVSRGDGNSVFVLVKEGSPFADEI